VHARATDQPWPVSNFKASRGAHRCRGDWCLSSLTAHLDVAASNRYPGIF